MKIKLLATALLCSLAATAGTPALDRIADEVVANNPSIQSLKAGHAADIMERRAGNMLEAAEVGFDMKWSQFDRHDTKMGFEVTQGFDWPGKYGRERKAIRGYERMLKSVQHSAEAELRLNVQLLLLDVVDANRRYDLLSRMVANLDSLHGTLHQLLEQRQITELDHRKTALEEIALRQQLAAVECDRTDALAQLAMLNGGELPAGVADLNEFPHEELMPMTHYLELPATKVAQLRLEAESARLDAASERMALYPGFTLGYAFEREDNTNFHGFTLGIRLPEYSASNRSKVAEFRANSLDRQAEQAESERHQAVATTYRRAEVTAKLIADYQKALGNNYPQLLRRCIDLGQMTYAEYFTELNFYLSACLDCYTQELEYHKTLTRLKTILN